MKSSNKVIVTNRLVIYLLHPSSEMYLWEEGTGRLGFQVVKF